MNGDKDLTSLTYIMCSHRLGKLKMAGKHKKINFVLHLTTWWNVKRKTRNKERKYFTNLSGFALLAWRGWIERIPIWHPSTYSKWLKWISFIIVSEKCCHRLLSQEYCISIWTISSRTQVLIPPVSPQKAHIEKFFHIRSNG